MPQKTMGRQMAWMRYVLIAAAIYNSSFGVWVVLFPLAAFQLLNLRAPEYPELWQCVGMMAAIYGVGCGIASADPFRHWPVVFAGLLANAFGAVGMISATLRGRLPGSSVWMILNDVFWCVPFGLILRSVWRQELDRRRQASGGVLSFALRAQTDAGLSLHELSFASPVLVVFLRHAGCTFCREAVADIARQRREIENSGATLVLVHMGEKELGRELFRRHSLDDLPQISDPSQNLYRAFGLRRGTLPMIFGPGVWIRVFEAGVLRRHGVGWLAGDGFQMPGIFMLFHGHVLRGFRHQSVADRPDYAKFVRDVMAEALP